jgi:hypothetical protein
MMIFLDLKEDFSKIQDNYMVSDCLNIIGPFELIFNLSKKMSDLC